MNVAFHCGNCPAFPSRESTANEATKTMLLGRQKEYKMAALRAKKQGDVEQAKLYFMTSKVSRKTTSLSDLFKTKTVSPVQQCCVCIHLNLLKVCLLCCVPALYSTR